MSQKNTLKALGLYTNPNQLSGTPDGAMVKAENVVIDRDDIVEQRRGFSKYGNTFGDPSDRAKQLIIYKNRALIHYGDKLLFNSNPHNLTVDGNFQQFDGSYSELDTGLRIKSIESNKNLYFTTNDGIKKISATSATDFTTSAGFIRDAGAIKALDLTGTLHSKLQGFLPPNSKVSYRLIWSYKDLNDNLIAGSPSSRLVISNYSTSNATVDLEFAIPQNITSDYFYQIYRSAIFTATGSLTLSDIDPGDELRLVIEDFPTTAELTAGLVTLEELAPDDFRQGGLDLYTNPSSGEGIGQANELPPKAKDIAMYQNTVFYANTETRANTAISLLGVENLVSGTSSISIDGQTYTFVGTNEQTKIDFTSYSVAFPAALASLNGKYFLLNSASNKHKYYVWFDNTKTSQIIDFTNYIGTIPADLKEKFFVLHTKDLTRKYYIWYDSTGSDIDPGTNIVNGLTGYAGIKVVITGFTTAAQVVNATQTEISLNDVNLDFDIEYSSGISSTATLGVTTNINKITHGLVTGDKIKITNSTTTPAINNEYTVTVVDNDNFTIPVTTTVSGIIDWLNSRLIIKIESIDETLYTITENLLKGFSFTFSTQVNIDPAKTPLVNTDVVGRSPFKLNISRNITSNATLVDALAAALLEQDNALDFTINYTATNTYLDILNNNNGNTDDTIDSTISPIGNSFTITINQQGTGENSASNYVLLSAAASPAQQIDETARSLVNIINKNALDTVYAYYLSGPTDLPGQILLQVRDIGVNQFSVIANDATTGGNFNPSLPPYIGAAPVLGKAEIKLNRLYFAKIQQPEAVPLLNFLDVGPQDKAIVRILALRESLFVLKEDGVYRLTGSNGSYAVDLFDASTRIVAPDSAVVLNNQLFCLTNLGIVNISDTGVSIISMSIESDIQKLTSSNYNFKYTTFGVSYENDKSYLLWMPKNKTDTIATMAYRYSTNTNTFTTYNLSKTCGIVNPGDDKLYLGTSDTNYIERERKLFDRTDYSDRDFELIIPSNSVNGTSLRLSSSVDVISGDSLVQTQYVTINDYNQLLKKLDLDPSIGIGEQTEFDYSTYIGSIPLDLHGKYFIIYSATDAKRYAIFYDAIGSLLSLDTTVYNDIADAIQIRVDVSSGVTTKDQIALATKTAIQSSTLDFIVSYTSPNEFFDIQTIRHGLTSDASDSAVNGLSNGFDINILQQGVGDYFSSLEMKAGDSIYSKLSELALRLDNDPGVTDVDYLVSVGSPTTFAQAQVSFNAIVDKLNLDTGVTYQNYSQSSGTEEFEVLILSKALNTTDVNIQFSILFMDGPVTVYKGIKCDVIYTPETFGDTSTLKQISESTVMFEDNNFSRATVGFRTDLSPGFEIINFTKSGKGNFGSFVFSEHNWGGGFSGIPLRTYIPRQKQRCRFIQLQFLHNSSRERVALFGFSYTFRLISEKAYK